jgi:HK97 gp10 family phage protein
VFKASLALKFDHVEQVVAKVEARAVTLTADTSNRIRGRASDWAPKLTGALAGDFVVNGSGASRDVTNTAPYFGYVENGTVNMGAQPSLGPAAHAEDATWAAVAGAAIAEAMR